MVWKFCLGFGIIFGLLAALAIGGMLVSPPPVKDATPAPVVVIATATAAPPAALPTVIPDVLPGVAPTPQVVVAPFNYPATAVTHFVSMCRADGNGQVLCSCYIKSMQQHYPYSQVRNILTVNNSDAPEWDAVTKDCASVAAQ